MSQPDLPDDDTRVRPKKPGSGAGTGVWVPAGLAPQPVDVPKALGRFEIVKVLGDGAFGVVYLARDPHLGRPVAIKVPKPEGLTPEFRDRFLREARATATIHHPNVCPVYEVGTEGDLPFIVMHYVVGGTLDGVLKRLKEPLPPRHALAIARKLALGISAAHANGVIHRDLKPANVLYDAATREVLITDFGLARLADSRPDDALGDPTGSTLREATAERTVEGRAMGSPAYMPPEQWSGRRAEIGPLSDVYSLGVVLYQMLTGGVPFTGSVWELMAHHANTPPAPPSARRSGLDPVVDALCLKALAKAPKDRYDSARSFADALGKVLRASDPADAVLPRGVIGPDTEPLSTRSSSALAPSQLDSAAPETPELSLPPGTGPQPLSLPDDEAENESAQRRHVPRWALLSALAVLLVGIAGLVALGLRKPQTSDPEVSPNGTVANRKAEKFDRTLLVGQWKLRGAKVTIGPGKAADAPLSATQLTWEFTSLGRITAALTVPGGPPVGKGGFPPIGGTYKLLDEDKLYFECESRVTLMGTPQFGYPPPPFLVLVRLTPDELVVQTAPQQGPNGSMVATVTFVRINA